MSLPQVDGAYQGQFSASDARRWKGFLAVPTMAARDHGPAAQTLGGLLQILRQDGRTTFRRQPDIAKAAGVSLRTARTHLKTLEAAGLVKADQSAGSTTRYVLGVSEAELMEGGFLPVPRYVLDRPWTERVVYAWVVFRAELSLDGATVEDSIGRVGKVLGIDRRAVRRAVAGLESAGLLERERLLAGEPGRLRLAEPPAHRGEDNLAEPTHGGEDNLAEPPRTILPMGEDNLADPSFIRRRSKNMVQERLDQIRFSIEDLTPIAAELFRRCGYRGDDGRNIWKVAALLSWGLVSEHEAYDAAQGCRECSPKDRVAYFVAILKSHVASRGKDLVALLRQVRIVPTWPSGPPKLPERTSTADLFKRP